MIFRHPHHLVLLLMGIACAGCGGIEGYSRDLVAANKGELAIVDTALVIGNCGRFAAAVTRAGLTEQLDGDGPFTVFVPLDEAFLSLDADQRLAMNDDPEHLRELLLGHVLLSEVRAPQLIHATELETAQGGSLTVSIEDRQVMVDGARILRGDVIARNGIIHFVDKVLLPTTGKAPVDD